MIPTAFLQAWSTKAPWPDLDERIGGGETLNPAYFKAHLEARCL